MEEKKVLAMYDVRGIQSYIFKTNKVKDIIGASILVEGIIEKAFCFAAEKLLKENEYIYTWENNESLKVLEEESSVLAQVLFIGGGNAYIAYRKEEDFLNISREMSKYVLTQTYSLQLAIAMVKMTSDYYQDYKSINKEMTRIKESMPMTRCMGTLPIVKVDAMTGYPITIDSAHLEDDEVSTEVRLKRAACETRKEGKEKEFDNLITQKGEESQIAIIHIDGNNLGMRIRQLMEAEEMSGKSYGEYVERMRLISCNIKTKFATAYENMDTHLKNWVKSDHNKVLKKGDVVYLRKIIIAGDDVTFVCNAKIAMSLVEYFVKAVSKECMFWDENMTKEQNLKNYGFSVCAGIAYINSHFPFSTGYEVAEECCESAKKKAKLPENLHNEKVGNWFDFQICRNVQANSLHTYREKNYHLADGSFLLRRPWCIITDQNVPSVENNYEELKVQFRKFGAEEKIARTYVKKLRNTYPHGREEMKKLIAFMDSRGNALGKESEDGFKNNLAVWYDALEMEDFYLDINKEEN